jgi:hypothetical protein
MFGVGPLEPRSCTPPFARILQNADQVRKFRHRAASAARSIMRAKQAVVNGDPRSLSKTKGGGAVPLEPAQGPEFIALDRVRARRAVLDPADVEHGAVEVDLVPSEVADLGRPQAVPVSEEHHGRVSVAVPVSPRGLNQPLDLAGGEVLPGPEVGVLRPSRNSKYGQFVSRKIRHESNCRGSWSRKLVEDTVDFGDSTEERLDGNAVYRASANIVCIEFSAPGIVDGKVRKSSHCAARGIGTPGLRCRFCSRVFLRTSPRCPRPSNETTRCGCTDHEKKPPLS